jgi:hypothetical protein
MCSMSLTVVVSARSNGRDDAPRHLVGRQALYCQATPMIGMLMLGKISTGMRKRGERAEQENEQAPEPWATTNV